MGAKIYETISQGLHKNIEFITFLILIGIISIFINKRITLTAIAIRIQNPKYPHNNNVPKMKIVRNKIDSFNRQ